MICQNADVSQDGYVAEDQVSLSPMTSLSLPSQTHTSQRHSGRTQSTGVNDGNERGEPASVINATRQSFSSISSSRYLDATSFPVIDVTCGLPTILSESRDLRVDTFGLALYSLFPMFSCAQNFVCCLCCRALVSSGAGRITL